MNKSVSKINVLEHQTKHLEDPTFDHAGLYSAPSAPSNPSAAALPKPYKPSLAGQTGLAHWGRNRGKRIPQASLGLHQSRIKGQPLFLETLWGVSCSYKRVRAESKCICPGCFCGLASSFCFTVLVAWHFQDFSPCKVGFRDSE